MSPDKAIAFGLRLRELRERAGLTQSQLAEKSGLHRQGIVKLELGEREPAWSTLLALAEALCVEVGAFAESPTNPIQEPRRGRPPKVPSDQQREDAGSKRPRGRPRKTESDDLSGGDTKSAKGTSAKRKK